MPAGAPSGRSTAPPRGGAGLQGTTACRALRPGEPTSLDAAHQRLYWGVPAQPRPVRPPSSPMWMMESARTVTHWHIQGRSHSVSASMSPGRAAHPPGPGARPRAARSGEARVPVQSRAAPRESGARPCVFPRAPAPAPCARPSPAQPSALGLPRRLRLRLRRRSQPKPRPARRGRPAAVAATLPAARAALGEAEAEAAAAARPERRLRAGCVSEPRQGANCGGRPLPSPSPSAALPLPSRPPLSPPPSSPPRDCGALASPRAACSLVAWRGRPVLRALRREMLRGRYRGRDLARLRREEAWPCGLGLRVRGRNGGGTATDCPRGGGGLRALWRWGTSAESAVAGTDRRSRNRTLDFGSLQIDHKARGTEPGTRMLAGWWRARTLAIRADFGGHPSPAPRAVHCAGSRAGGSDSEAQFMAGNRRSRDRGAWT